MERYKYHKDNTLPLENENWIFVFGSNLSGIHGAGAAKVACDKFGAMIGNGIGFSGNSFAIPTKDFIIKSLNLDTIKLFIRYFECVTRHSAQQKYWVTRVGCGLAGYSDKHIAPLFKGCNPHVVSMPEPWKIYLEN